MIRFGASTPKIAPLTPPNSRIGGQDHLTEARQHAAGEVEEQVAQVAERALDVVAELEEEQHVAEQVPPHACKTIEPPGSSFRVGTRTGFSVGSDS